MKKASIIIMAMAALISCTSETPKTKNTSTVKTTPVKPKANWEYSEEEDKISGQKEYTARNESTSRVYLKMPYEEEGGSSFTFRVRKNGSGTDVMVSISTGRFLTSVLSENNTARVRFDNDKPITFAFGGTTDHSDRTIFFEPVKKFISRLKTSKKMFIEVTFYDNGTHVLEFNTDGFNWNH